MKVTRAIFKKYLLSQHHKEKHTFEKEHLEDELTMDAIEGFKANEGAWTRFEQLEEQFASNRKRKLNKYLIISMIAVILVGFLFIESKPNAVVSPEIKTNIAATKSVKEPIRLYKKQDLIKLQPLAQKEQITASIVTEDFQQKRNENTTEERFIEPMKQLPVKGIQAQSSKNRKLARKIARELLIRNFKVIDYRYYRKSDVSNDKLTREVDDGEVTNIPYINVLSEAIEDFSEGNYKLSLLAFDQILYNFPNDANALFYSALSLYNLNEFGETKNRLEKLRVNEFANFEEEADWYLLLVYKQQKNEAAFSSLKKVIIETNGFYAEKAKVMNL